LINLVRAAWPAERNEPTTGPPYRRAGYDEARGIDWTAVSAYASEAESRASYAMIVNRLRASYDSHWRGDVAQEQAAERARGLLLRLLSPKQRASFEATHAFAATGQKTGHVYSIREERQINITCTTTGDRWCYVCPDVPICDQLVAQKLLIEGDEERFLSVASGTPWARSPSFMESRPALSERRAASRSMMAQSSASPPAWRSAYSR
jgi:hypothetical protein